MYDMQGNKIVKYKSIKQLKQKSIMNSGKAVLGVLAGVAVGAILGILLVPDKGSNTRRQILSKGKDYVDGIKEKYESTKRNVEEFADEKKTKYDNIKKDLSHAASDIKHAAS